MYSWKKQKILKLFWFKTTLRRQTRVSSWKILHLSEFKHFNSNNKVRWFAGEFSTCQNGKLAFNKPVFVLKLKIILQISQIPTFISCSLKTGPWMKIGKDLRAVLQIFSIFNLQICWNIQECIKSEAMLSTSCWHL